MFRGFCNPGVWLVYARKRSGVVEETRTTAILRGFHLCPSWAKSRRIFTLGLGAAVVREDVRRASMRRTESGKERGEDDAATPAKEGKWLANQVGAGKTDQGIGRQRGWGQTSTRSHRMRWVAGQHQSCLCLRSYPCPLCRPCTQGAESSASKPPSHFIGETCWMRVGEGSDRPRPRKWG